MTRSTPSDSNEPFSPLPQRQETPPILRRQRTLHFFFGRKKCGILMCFICLTAAVIVGTVLLVMRDAHNRKDNDGPDEGPAEEGAIGWNASDSMVGPDDAWCRIAAPIEGWSLGCPGASDGVPSVEVRLLTYNLFWWNLFHDRNGNDGSAGKLIAAAASAPAAAFDFMGFQECEDVERVMHDANLSSTFGTYPNTDVAIAIAYNIARWEALTSGTAQVAEDQEVEGQYYVRRSVLWARFRERTTDRIVFFANHHGPLQVNTGGLCGGPATAYNLLRVISFHAHPGDAILLVGDFNADPTAGTIRTLAEHLDLAYTGEKFNGVDNIFAACAQISEQGGQNLGSGGSDHDALSATLLLQ